MSKLPESTFLFLAPMEGVIDPPMRDLLTSMSQIDYCVTEFIRVSAQIVPQHVLLDIMPELHPLHPKKSRTSNGTPVIAQLLGSDATLLAENAQMLIEMGAVGIDLNFGCPAPTVNRHEGGSVLLKNPEKIFNIVSQVRKVVPVHISFSSKMRLGYEHADDCVSIARVFESAGVDFLTVHARTKKDGYKPPAYWDYIRQINDLLKIPVIANGEIEDVNSFIKCKKESASTIFMVGRAALKNPYIFTQIRQNQNTTADTSVVSTYENSGQSVTKLNLLTHMVEYFEKASLYKSPFYSQAKCKQWFKSFCAYEINPANHSDTSIVCFTDLFNEMKLITDPVVFKDTLLRHVDSKTNLVTNQSSPPKHLSSFPSQ